MCCLEIFIKIRFFFGMYYVVGEFMEWVVIDIFGLLFLIDLGNKYIFGECFLL